MSNRSITGYHLNTFTIRISRRFPQHGSSKWGISRNIDRKNVGQDFIVLDFFVGGRSCGRKRCVQEINVSRAGDPVYAGNKALTWGTPTQRGRVNRYVLLVSQWGLAVILVIMYIQTLKTDSIWRPFKSNFHNKTLCESGVMWITHFATYLSLFIFTKLLLKCATNSTSQFCKFLIGWNP